MNLRLWMPRLVVAVTVLAVAAGAAAIGTLFAAHDRAEVLSGSVRVPVLAPVASGEEQPPADLDGDAGTVDVSEAVAEREVRLPGAPGEVDPGLMNIIDELADAADPAFELIVLDSDAEDATSGADDDPCAPRDGEAAEDCPDGLHTTVLPITGLTDFRAGGQVYPPTREEFLEHGNRLGGSIWCDGLVAGEGEAPFGLVATAPGNFTLRYWPTERPDEVQVMDDIVTSDADREAFVAAVAAGDSPDLVNSCAVIGGLEPGTAYTATLTGVDIYDRISAPHTFYFHSDGAPTRPGAQIVTIGENLVFVSGLHPVGQTVQTRVYLTGTDATPTCEPVSGARQLSPLTDVEASVDAETLAAANFRGDLVRKRVQTFKLPEGSTALVCVRWFDDSAGSSWEREQAVFESSAVLQNPDRILPVVQVTRIHNELGDALSHLTFSLATAEGTPCGYPIRWIQQHSELELPFEVCGRAAFAGGGVTTEADRIWDVGFAGDLVFTAKSTLDDGQEQTMSYLLPAPDAAACRGVCELPETDWFSIALGRADVASGLCGSAFGSDCTVPTEAAIIGAVQVSLSWNQGSSNGLSAWNITPTVDVAPEYEQPDAPRLDLDEEWRFSSPVSGRPNVTATYRLHVDRPVDYTLRLTTSPGTAAPACGIDGVLEVSGSTGGTSEVSIPGVCIGENYQAEVELVDEAGHRALWGSRDRDTWWGANAHVFTPSLDATVSYSLHAQGFTHSAIEQARILVGANGVDLTRTLDYCDVDGVIQTTGTFPAHLAAVSDVVLVIDMQNSGNWTPDNCGRNLDGEPTKSVIVRVGIEQLMSSEGVVIDAPDVFRARLTLHATASG